MPAGIVIDVGLAVLIMTFVVEIGTTSPLQLAGTAQLPAVPPTQAAAESMHRSSSCSIAIAAASGLMRERAVAE